MGLAIPHLIALPLRVLRPDPETEFLAFSLPDAITSSLSTLQSLVVRSSLAASRFAGTTLELARIAADADVDVVLAGTMLRAGDQLRVATQLLEAPSGTVLWSDTAQAPVIDLFALQDELTHRIVAAFLGDRARVRRRAKPVLILWDVARDLNGVAPHRAGLRGAWESQFP